MPPATYRNLIRSAAETYQDFFVPTIATPAAIRLMHQAAIQPGERVLDLACGTGVISRLAAEAVGPSGAVTGVDLAADMIDVAASVEAIPGVDIDWRVADATSLPFADSCFDIVLCQMGLMFIEDRAQALAEMHRVLAPGGRVVINTPGAIQAPFMEMEKAIVEQINRELAGFVRVVFSMHDPVAVGALLTAAGFADVSTSEYTAHLDLPEPAELLRRYVNLTPMAPTIAAASDGAKAAMEAQVVEALAGMVVGGRLPLDQPMVLASGARDG